MKEVIIKNAAECLACHDLIESRSVHDFRSCKCGKISVDGGKEYLRRLFDGHENLIERSEVEYHPVSQWLTQRLISALTNYSGGKIQTVVRNTVDSAFAWEAPHNIIEALRELPFVKALSYEDLQLLEKTIKKELTGKDS